MESIYAKNDQALRRALDLLRKIPLVDGHNDLPLVIREDAGARGDVAAYRLGEDRPGRDTDIPKLRRGCVSAQFWAAFSPRRDARMARMTLEQIDQIHRINEAHPDTFLPATRSGDIKRAKKLGKIASFIAVEGAEGLENSLAPLRIWYQAGARLLTPCHNETLDWVDSATDEKRHGGLTAFGRAVVREANRLGMIVDCAHVSDAVMHQVLDISAAPIVFSHSNARALTDHPRNVPDDVLARVVGKRSVVMATFVPGFLSQASRDWHRPLQDEYGKGRVTPDSEPSLAKGGSSADAAIRAQEMITGRPWIGSNLLHLVEHIEYIVDKTSIRSIGIGSDFYGGPGPDGLSVADCYPHVIAELIRRGWSDDAVARIAAENFIDVFRQVEAVSRRLRQSEPPLIGRIDEFDRAVGGRGRDGSSRSPSTPAAHERTNMRPEEEVT